MTSARGHLRLSRRSVLELGACSGAALAIELLLPRRVWGDERSDETFAPNAWLVIDRTSTVTITVAKTEMGQGVWTALPMVVAEELDAEWTRVRVRQADARPGDSYQSTGGSSSVSDSWDLLRRAGAVARHMLIAAAARRWDVATNTCTTADGFVTHAPSGRTVAYGDLVEAAASQEDAASQIVPDSATPTAVDSAARAVPDAATQAVRDATGIESIALKPRSEYRLIGRALPRLDAPAKVRGEAVFGIDVRVPGLLHAVVARCPTFGGRLKRVDASRATAVPGVRQIVELPPVGPPTHLRGGVAVVADSTWAALAGRRALIVEWEPGPHAALDSAAIRESFRQGAAREGKVASTRGTVDDVVAGAGIVEATYEYPFLAHATMEPGNCTARMTSDGLEIWAPTQHPVRAQRIVARMLGVRPEQVTLHVTFAGGAFGRRLNDDFVVEAAMLAQRVAAPVQILWTRDDDLQHDFYRQAGLQQLRAVVDARGLPTTLVHRVIGPSTHAFYTPNHPRPEEQELWGATNLPYAIPNHRVEYVQVDTPVPIGWWRAVSVSQNQFCIEAFVSELARRARRDPIEYRRALLPSDSRLHAVLEAVAELAEWRTPVPRGRGRGVAIAWGGGTCVAEAIECSLTPRRDIHVHRVSCAIDCGLVVNPNIVQAQTEGSIVWGLTAALFSEITIAGGVPQQQHFADYPMLRLRDMPELRIRILDSPADRPSGIGEPCVVPVAPALAAAVGDLLGTPVRSLPIRPRRASE